MKASDKQVGGKEDLIGQRFNRLTVIKDTGDRSNDSRIFWLCQCDCGNLTKVRSNNLKSGQVKSCGCLRQEITQSNNIKNQIHGDAKKGKIARLYRIWRDMKGRCKYVYDISYKWYGGKGIKVCNEWQISYQAFKNWALASGYNDNLTIDRINSNKDYSPDNCQWLTNAENIAKGQKERWTKKHQVGKLEVHTT